VFAVKFKFMLQDMRGLPEKAGSFSAFRVFYMIAKYFKNKFRRLFIRFSVFKKRGRVLLLPSENL